MSPDDNILYSVDETSSSAEAEIVDKGLGDFNRQSAPIHNVRPLTCFAKLARGEVIGGAVGRTWGLCCELQRVWVAESHRRRGIGRQLVRRFEEQAFERGCRTFYLETFSFQSPDFYYALGYDVRLTISGFPDGISKNVMVRELE